MPTNEDQRTSPDQPIETQSHDQRRVSVFWRRLAALLIDWLALTLVGVAIGAVAAEQLKLLGGYGLLVGFVITALYFSATNSKLCNGQSLGKKLLKLKVVNTQGETLCAMQSILRGSLFATLMIFAGPFMSSELIYSSLAYPAALILVGGSFASIYLYFFNRQNRQTLHDLIARTFVVDARVEYKLSSKFWKPHLIVVAIIFAVAMIIPIGLTKPESPLSVEQTYDLQTGLVNKRGISYSKTKLSTKKLDLLDVNSRKVDHVTVYFKTTLDPTNYHILSRELAQLVKQVYPPSHSGYIDIRFVYSYDTGLWSHSQNLTYTYDPRTL